jgi:ribosome biogenesis GTPase
MSLEDLGYNEKLERFRIDNKLEEFITARVIAEHRERYIVRAEDCEYEAEITGNMRFTSESREDFPSVGDWVSITVYDKDLAIINKIFPRYSLIKRQAAGHSGEVQIIAANIDFGFIIQAAENNFKLNRIERFITICNSSGVEPVIILSKTDLVGNDKLSEIIETIKRRIKNTTVLSMNSESIDGYNNVRDFMVKGKTYCMLGVSGAGKSTLLNHLSGKMVMKTDSISESTKKGRHITTHRELTLLDNGAILIDNPGMREVGITDSVSGLEMTFDDISILSHQCKYQDCTHTTESECAVIKAVQDGKIDDAAYNNFLKMMKERAFFELSSFEKRKKDKTFGKFLKNYNKTKNGFNID